MLHFFYEMPRNIYICIMKPILHVSRLTFLLHVWSYLWDWINLNKIPFLVNGWPCFIIRFHFNISEEIKALVQVKGGFKGLIDDHDWYQAIRTEMKPELIPMAEEKSNFGKIVKTAIRWVPLNDSRDSPWKEKTRKTHKWAQNMKELSQFLLFLK